MKHFQKTCLTIFCIAFFSASLFGQRPATEVVYAAESSNSLTFTIPVMNIIDNKCFGCHSEFGRSDDAKEALMWKNLQQMDAGEVVGLLEDVLEQVEEGTMPPEKIVKKYPGMELTEEDRAVLKAWIMEQQDKLDKDE